MSTTQDPTVPARATSPVTKIYDGHGLSRVAIIWKHKGTIRKNIHVVVPEHAKNHRVRQVFLWSDGFSLDDGPPLSYETPENKKILVEMFRGKADNAFFGVQPGESVEIDLVSLRDESFVRPEDRVAGYISKQEKRYVSLFRVQKPDRAAVVQFQGVKAPQVESHWGLLVEFTNVVEAAKWIDDLRPGAVNLAVEFIPDECLQGTLMFRGPPKEEEKPWQQVPPHLHKAGLKNQKAKEIVRRVLMPTGGEAYQVLYWEKIELVWHTWEAAKMEINLEREKQRRMAAGDPNADSFQYHFGDWVCPYCRQYNLKAETVCCNKASCGKFIFAAIQDDIDKALASLPPSSSQHKKVEDDGRYQEGNITFLSAPTNGRVEKAKAHPWKLPLMDMFLEGTG